MNIDFNNKVAPSIKAIPLQYSQKFPTNGVSKNTITFDRIEDMMIMCLSTFVHDYVHDYNLGTMHARVIKGNINRTEPDKPSIFETLGINIGNTIFKEFAYPIGGHRDVSMYKDEQFEDVNVTDTEKTGFYNCLNNNEENIQNITGGDRYAFEPQSVNLTTDETELEPIVEKPIIEEPIVEEPIVEEPIVEEPIVEKPIIEEPIVEKLIVEEPIVENITDDTFISTKSIGFNDLKDVLFIPEFIGNLNMEEIISHFEKNADFLAFHSSLNTYVVTYLGYDTNNNGEFNQISKDKYEVSNNAIKSSLKYIINDLKDKNKDLFFNFYGDIFSLLLDSYEIIRNHKNNENPFDILNSPELLYQFIVLYVSYISIETYDILKEFVKNKMKGGEPPDDEIEMKEMDSNSNVETSKESYTSNVSSILPTQENELIEVPEYVFITHNNLLTTITRGMFIKLGIWKKIFFPNIPIEDITPDYYKFGPNEINQITYDKLVELFPIKQIQDTELFTGLTTPSSHANNELLILEILILKRLLVEMSPSKTITFGAKIDDDLKNYMDSFYLYNYDIKDFPKEDVSENIISDVMYNPNFKNLSDEEQENEIGELFSMDDDCFDNSNDFSPINCDMKGGMNYEDRMSIVEAKRELANANEKLLKLQNKGEIIEQPLQTINDDKLLGENMLQITGQNLDEDIIKQPRLPGIPILFNKLKKMYQNNMLTIRQLKNSKIQPINCDGVTVDNLFKLLELNQILMHKKDTTFNIPAPKYKFVINNAANVGSNLNGSKMFVPKKFLQSIKTIVDEIKQKVFNENILSEEKLSDYTTEIELLLDDKQKESKNKYDLEIKELNMKKRKKIITIREYNKLLELTFEKKKFERLEINSLENTLFLLKVLKNNISFYNDFTENYEKWFRDSQPLFGLYRSLQRGIFCPTTSMMDAMDNCSLKYEATEPKEVGTSYSEIIHQNGDNKISFGGVVLNYNQTVDEEEQLTAKIYYCLDCNNIGGCIGLDRMVINTLPIQVSESHNLKARVAYQAVISRIKEIYDSTDSNEEFEGVDYIKEMWKRMQYQYDQGGFNMLLSATALKTMGDYLQECQACFKWGGYINKQSEFPSDLIREKSFKKIKNKLIYRSVSKGGAIVPYDIETGDGLRLGIQGDRPSGFRSIYMLLNGNGDVNEQAITGYMFTTSTQNPSRTLLVSRNNNNMREPNINGLKGNVIYVTRELQVPDRFSLLKSLEFINFKEKTTKMVTPEINQPTIIGSFSHESDSLLENQMTKIQPLKNSAYDELLDYTDTHFSPNQTIVENEIELTDAETARNEKTNKSKRAKEKISGAKKKGKKIVLVEVEPDESKEESMDLNQQSHLEKESSDLFKIGGRTSSNKNKNKNKYKYYKTKRLYKKSNKLTKRNKHLKNPRKTRKNAIQNNPNNQ